MDLNLIDSENTGTMNSIREIRERRWPECLRLRVRMLMRAGVRTYLTRLGNEC